MRKKPKPLTDSDKNYIENSYLTKSIKLIARELDITAYRVNNFMRTNNLVVPDEIKQQRRKESYFKKGATGWNKGLKQKDYLSKEARDKISKTHFKNGHKPHNTKFDGAERITKDGYVEIRIKRGKYRLKHIHEWEKINGNLPDGHCLKCLDENKENTDPTNWKLISRMQNMLENSKFNYPKEIIPSMVLVCKLNNIIENGTK